MHARKVAVLYFFLKGVSSLFVAIVYTVELIYQAQRVGLNPFQLILAGTVNQCVVLVCQAPTGALADMYSRRWAVVIGLLLTSLGFFIEGAIPTFAAVLIAQAFWGLGASLQDGADAAWVADELGAQPVGSLYLRATQIGWFCTLPGIALGAGLGSVSLNLPLLAGAGGYLILGVLLAFLMPEQRGLAAVPEAQAKRTSWQQTFAESFRLIRLSPVLGSIFGISAFSALAGEGFGRLWQYHLLHTFTFPALGKLAPIVWFGIMEIGIALTNIAGIEIASRCITPTNQRSVALGLCLTQGAMLLGIELFALSGHFAVALAALWLITTASGPRLPLIQTWINQHTSSSVRATILSWNALISALAGMGGGLLIGVVATAFTTRPALVLTGLSLVPAFFLYAYTIRGNLPSISAPTQEPETSPQE